MSVLILLMTACVTKTKIEYVYDSPDVEFPLFPNPEPVVLNEEAGTVEMPLWYWEKIAEYKLEVDAIEVFLKKTKAMQERVLDGQK